MRIHSLLTFACTLVIASSVFAFGGGGGGGHSDRTHRRYEGGVDGMGIHIDGNSNTPDIDFRDCADGETLINRVCCPNDRVLDDNTCCAEGTTPQDGICKKSCAAGLVLVEDECTDLCANYQPELCASECDWHTGNPIFDPSDTVCGDNMHCSGTSTACVCNDTFIEKNANSCKCPDKQVIQQGRCVDLCASYAATECMPACDWQTGSGIPEQNKLCQNGTGRCSNTGDCEPISCPKCQQISNGVCVSKCGLCEVCDEQQDACILDPGKEIIQGQCVSVCLDTQERIGLDCLEKCGTGEKREGHACICDNTNGWYGSSGACVQCTGEGVIYNGTSCACDTGYYGTAPQCTICPEHTSACGGTSYTCDAAGHWVDNGQGACQCDIASHYVINAQGTACECDSANGWNPDSTGACIQCAVVGTTYDSFTKSCICDATKHLTGEPGNCNCVPGYYGRADTQCTQCTDTHMSCPGGETFTCNNGYVSDDNICVCSGYVKDGICLDCPEHTSACGGTSYTCDAAGHWVDNGQGACQCDIASHYVINAQGTACECDSANGWNPDSTGACIQCAVVGTTYDSFTKSCICDATKHLTGEPGNCNCVSGYYGRADTQCTQCTDTHMSCPGGETFTCNNGYVSDDSICVCSGYVKDGICLDCPEHTSACGGTSYTCDAAGHWVDNGQGACQCDIANNWVSDGENACTCAENYQPDAQGTACVIDPCLAEQENYPDCLANCVSEHGSITSESFKTTCENGYACDNTTHLCVCKGYIKNGVCMVCPENASCHGTTFTCPDGWEQTDTACVEPCAIDPADECILEYVSINGSCEPVYKGTTDTCGSLTGDNQHYCNGTGLCTCPEGTYETTTGTCSSCQIDKDGVEMSQAECNQCTGTFYVDGKCFPACSNNEWMEATFDNGTSTTRKITGAKCHPCDYTESPATAVSEESCNTCSGTRFMGPDLLGGPKCFYCGAQDKEMSMVRGSYQPTQSYIDSCNNCLNRTYNPSTKKCECDADKLINGSTCCPPGQIANSDKTKCVEDFGCSEGQLYSFTENRCVSCAEADGTETTLLQCNSCNMIFTDNSICRNKPENDKIMDNNGTVYDCDSYVDNIGILDASYCSVCSNRFYVAKGNRTDCYRCDTATSYKTTEAECGRCPNRSFDPDTKICGCGTELQSVTREVCTWDEVNRVHVCTVRDTQFCPYEQ